MQLTEEEIKKLNVLKRKQKTLEDNKMLILKNLEPILSELESIRLKIDEIELK